MNLDPIQLALVQNRLDHVSRQMGWVMTRTARSPIFNQSHDFSCFITDPAGTLVSQANGIPIHTGGGGFAVRALLAAFADDIAEGDVFLLNDPYVAGGNHLPDWVIARPIFVDATLVAFCCNRAHQSDISGGAAGTYNAEATEIFHEGVRLPPLKLIEAGGTRQDLWNLLLLNSRTPDLQDGDLRAMVGSTRIGGERVAGLIAELGVASGLAYFEAILDHADRRFRTALSELPDGRYEATEVIDNDCFEFRDITIRLALEISADTARVDFTGTDGQILGFKNSSLANTYSAVYMALASYFEPDLPRNEGTFRGVEITAPEGSIINPRPPAPVTMCTVFVAHEIVHAVWKALAEADPARSCAGWAKSIHSVTAGGIGSDRPFVLYHWHAMPGGGATGNRDGFNTIGHLIALGGLHLPNAETYEQVYPIRIERQEFRCDGGGPGEFRGGSGIDYEARVLTAGEHTFRGEGVGAPSGFGIAGGEEGKGGVITVYPEGQPDFEAPKYGKRNLPPARITAASPGGGGWGEALERQPGSVLRDVRDGLVSFVAARDTYGVVLDDACHEIDNDATNDLRTRLSQERGITS